MHIKIDKDEFLNGIKIIETGIYKNKIKPYMEGMKIKTNNDSIILTASNLDFIIEHKIKCQIINAGSAVTKITEIKGFLKYLFSENNTIEIYSENDNLIIKTDNQKLKTKLSDRDEFLDHKIMNSTTFIFDKTVLLPLFEKLKICASQYPENLAVNCIRLETEDNFLKLISTDTYRMLLFKEELEEINQNKAPVSISIPLNTINALIRTMKINQNNILLLDSGDDRINFKISNTTILSRTIDLNFPDHKSILQNTVTDKVVILKKQEFMQILKQIMPVSKKNYEAKYRVILSFTGNILNIEAGNDISSINASLLCQKSGEDLKISLNSKYLIEALKSLDSEYVEINMSGSKSSVIIKKTDDSNSLYLAMPLAI